jgi:glyoxylase-like metal-dependent hydrolase (beta-lactamase superfamily II)
MFFIEGPSRRIIVDAAPSAQQLQHMAPPGITLEPIATPEDALASVGLKPEEIDVVILTHLHQDHAINVTKFVNAEIYLQADELYFARTPHVFWASGYSGVNIEALTKMKLKLIEGEYLIDDSVSVMLTPGHTPGTQSVIVETEHGPAIIAGFCSIRENFDPPEQVKAQGIEVIPPGVMVNFMDAYDSTLKVKKQAKIIIPCHEYDLPARIP